MGISKDATKRKSERRREMYIRETGNISELCCCDDELFSHSTLADVKA